MGLYEKPIDKAVFLLFFPFSNHTPSPALKRCNLKAEADPNHLIKMLKNFKAQHILHINAIFSRFFDHASPTIQFTLGLGRS